VLFRSRYFNDENASTIEGLHPVLQTVYAHRNVQSKNELDNQLTELLPFTGLLNIQTAVDCIVDAIKENKRILIVGDFDADGATSTAVAVRTLRQFGAKYVDYLVPNRFDFGYGLTVDLIKYAKDLNPELIITVDNGISSIEGVNYANEQGIDVVVTDHHIAEEQLPDAKSIVNPNQHGCPFPSKMLAGVGVIFYVMLAVRSLLRERDWFKDNNISEPNLPELPDLVALGTVADVVPLDQNKRILV